MLDQLINLVKEHAGDAIVNNPAIPNEKNNDAINETANSIMNSLKGQFSGGNLEAITGLFQNGNIQSNPLVGQISQMVSTQISQKFGLDASTANNVVSTMIPKVMEQFVNKTNDPNDSSFDLNSIVQNLSGNGGTSDALNIVKGLFGGK
jgi:uncharacterized protein YidB (DUF937 family)